MALLHASFTSFPYTTLFRSFGGMPVPAFVNTGTFTKSTTGTTSVQVPFTNSGALQVDSGVVQFTSSCIQTRSDAHTSELQSLRHIVSRLLLDDKQSAAGGLE